MTAKEAIENLKAILEEATETEDAVSYVTSVDAESLNLAISALEKQIPQKTQKDLQPTCNNLATDTISRQALCEYALSQKDKSVTPNDIMRFPSAQPTLYGYNVEHLILIAEVLRKENMPPERVAEALTDIGRIVAIVRDEFEKSFRKAVEQCMT